jgi:hypothetical protein
MLKSIFLSHNRIISPENAKSGQKLLFIEKSNITKTGQNKFISYREIQSP